MASIITFNLNKRLLFSVITVNLLAFATGNAYSWSSTVLPILQSNNTEKNPLGRPITSSEISWIASLMYLGASAGPISAGYCSNKIGRKKTLILFSIPMLISHLILAFATTIEEIVIARFMMGLGAGCAFTVIPIYVGEIAEMEIRGFLGCFMTVSFSLGLLMVYIIDPFVDMMILSFMLIVPIGFFLFLFILFVPESPYFYMARKEKESAEKSLFKFRDTDVSSILKELDDIEEIVKDSRNSKISSEILSSRTFRRAIIITTVLMVSQQFVGNTIILAYMGIIFDATGTKISVSTSSVAVAFIQLVVVFVSSFLVDKWGRRFLLITSTAGCILPLIMMSTFFYLQYLEIELSNLWWLPTFSLIVFIFTYNIGLASLPWILLGELFPMESKGLASSITAFTCLFLAFIMTLIFPSLEQLIGFHGAFFFFSVNSVLAFIFVLTFVPETKGKSFQDILRILDK
ncbi:hypothetical protein HHI36_016076 [Cryptolaemus montrouzieri]|uniref:Major facilitator superfamily (MFS) profile domain-containing protein n=1 Tax=Cryptolaemus montrouzieri TaxID=559131 RepID=A0ABD2N8R3_9CUCU